MRPFSRSRCLVALSSTVLLFVCLSFSLPVFADVWTHACGDDPFNVKTVFDKSEFICVAGTGIGGGAVAPDCGFFPCADIYVMANRTWAGGEALADVMGSENRVWAEMSGGGFGLLSDIMIVTPAKAMVGDYDIILDNNLSAKFDGNDEVNDIGTGIAFRIIDLGHPPVDVSAIKNAAKGMSQGASNAIAQWNAGCNALDALGIGLSLMSGDYIGAAFGILGNITGIPTDYNGAVISKATELIGGFNPNSTPQKATGIYGNLAKHWYDLYEDPPDANYTEFATVNFSALNAELAASSVAGSYPFLAKGSDPREAALIRVANRSVEQAALVKALRQSYEKYQGAVAVSNYEYAYRQIEQARQYGQWLAANMDAFKNDIQYLKSVLVAYGVADKVYKASDLQALKDRVTASGLTMEEVVSLKNVGFSDERITLLTQLIKALNVPVADFTMSESIDALSAQVDTALPGIQTFNANALATMTNLVTEFTPHHPLVNAGGPYTGTTGSQILLNGSGSSDPDVGDTLTYAWDLDGDGLFDDAAGATVLHTWTTPIKTLIGLQVTDSTGRSSIGYAQAIISAGNTPPVITAFTPSATSLSASVHQPLTFTVAATDPDNDPLTYEWTLDGSPVGTGTSYTLTPGSTDSGTRLVLVTVRDNNTASQDTVEGRIVRIYSDVDGDNYDSSVDCNDNDATVHPGAIEILNNGKDDDCNPATADFVCNGLPPSTFYRDADGDSYGNPLLSVQDCTAPAGYVADNTDCNDADLNIHPGASEVCNGKDDNCNGQIDEGVSTTFYLDADNDGYGNLLAPLQACSAPAGYVTNGADCNDSNFSVNPGATEIMYDGIDNDCNPLTFDTVDADGDGYPSSLDCNDSDPLVNPGRREVIHNGKDDDCNPATMDNWSKSFVLGIDDASWIYYAKSAGDGTFSNYRTLDYLGSGTSRGITIEDFNGDGFLDFIAGRGNGEMYLFTNDGNDNFTNNGVVGIHPNSGGYIMDMAAGDFNNDGLTDFIANGNTNVSALFLNDGKGGFTRSTITLPNTGRGLDVADFDGDGNLDFAASFYGTNNVWVYRGNGAGGFTGASIGTATTSANDNYALAAADFDNDGKTDIIVGGSSNGDTYFFKGNGDGSFAAGVLVPTLDTDNYHNSIDAYDLNNDGYVDIVMGNYGSNNKLWFYPGKGDGTFGTRTAISPLSTRSSLLAVSAPPVATKAAGAPFAVVSPKSQAVAIGSPAALNGLFSYDPDGVISSYAWKFGDGGTATDATVSHPFVAEGRYLTSLVVTDGTGRAGTDVAVVKALGAPPVANAGGPYSVGEAQASSGRYSVSLNGSASTDDGGIVSYEWDFGDGFTDNFDDGNALGWSQLQGTWAVDGGSYRQTNASIDRSDTFVGNLKSGDYTVEADIMLLAGSGQEAQLLFRGLDQNNHYELIFRGRGYNDMLFYRVLNGGSSNLASVGLGFVPQLNTWYHLKVEAYGSSFRCYLNGSLMLVVNDTNLPNGKVGFSTYYSDARFDNLKVTSKGTGVNPTHLYAEGSYTATLKVTDKAGQTATATASVTASKGIPPVANAGGPYLLDETIASQNTWTVTLDGSASVDDSGIQTYSWDFGDGSALGTVQKPTHTYTGVGTYNVTLTVTDRAGQTSMAKSVVTTSGNALPVANPGGPYNVNEDQVVNKHWTINVDASASTDDVGIWKYEWNFGDGTAVVTTKTATHTYAIPGTYTVALKVTDHANQTHTATTTASVVTTGAPTANAGGPYFTEPNMPVVFDGTASIDNIGIFSYEWNFGDGTTGKGAQPTHTYTSTGSYPVILTVKDAALQTATATSTVTVVVGNPPVANAGGPYTSNAGVPIRLNGSGSTDDYGIVAYEWIVGATDVLLEDNFTGTVIDTAKWLFPTSGVTQNNAITLTGGGGWGSRYLFSKDDFALERSGVVTGQVTQTVGGNLMFGFKNTTTNFSYEQMPYALYFNNGTFNIYESGTNRGQVGSYAFNTAYDAKVELKMYASGSVAGARYYYKPASSAIWTLLYDSSYVASSATFKAGVSYYSGTYVVDNLLLTSGSQTLSGEKPAFIPPAAGTLPVQLTVTDGAGQSSTATSTLTVADGPLVITAPWQFTGGVEVPHDTWSGEEVILKAVVKSGKAPITYVWDFGDGTSSTPATVTDSYNLSVKHTYNATDGTPITARITVTDADGKISSDLYPIIIRAKTLSVEVNKAIDDALWYVHTTQNRTNGSWQSSGYTNGYYSSPTASAIHSMEINGHLEVGDFSNDPYVEDVWRGMQYVMTTLNTLAIGDQAYGDPDINGNGYGIQVNSGSPIYEGGQVMMALVASGTPNLIASTGGSGIVGRSYREIVEDMAEMYYWGQGDDVSGYGAGGWRYGWQGQADNSASQWAALGFEAAEEQNWIKVPQWVRDRNIVWLAYSRSGDGNGYGYTSAGNDVATTPSGLAQVAFDKIPTTDMRWKQVENFLASYWNNWYNGSGNYYALYALAKAMRTAKPKEITILGEGTTNAIDWYNDPTRGLARTIVNQQDANGMFTGGRTDTGTHWVEGAFRTAWGVIILTKTLFVLPPVAVAGENKVWGIDWPLILDGSKSYHLDPFRKIVKYEWDINGDGIYEYSSDQPTATHTYTELGTYKVTLRVTDNNDPPKYDTNSITVVVAVPPHPPVANPGGPYVGFVGIPLQLDGSKSYDIDPTDFITAYEWELDGVYPYNFSDATGATPTFVWDAPGTYNIGLKVSDNGVLSPNNEKLSDTKWTTVIIKQNNQPVANAGGPYTVSEGGTVTLDGSASSDPDGNALSYVWDLDNDGTFETTGMKPTFSRPDNGTFTVRLKVSDGGLESVATTVVEVLNIAPLVNPPAPAIIAEGSTYLGSGSFTDPGADTWAATVDYGDGTGVQPLTLSGKNFSLNHFYPQNGVYPVTIVVTDKDGATGSATVQVTATNVAPLVNAGPDVTLNNTRSFAGSGSFTDPGADTWTATVDYGDGTGPQPLLLNPDKTFAFAHTYAANGAFTVTVTVSDGDGGQGTDTVAVLVNNAAPVVNAGPDASLLEGGAFSSGGLFTDSSSTSWTATVDYGDGSGPQPLTLKADKTFDLQHVYGQNGVYTVTVFVTDDENGTGVDTAIVTVGNVAPTVNAGPDAAINAGGTFSSAGSFSDPGADTWSATVDYGDGSGLQPLTLNPDKTFSLGHVYDIPGSFQVTVTVNDGDGGSGSDTANVTVSPVIIEPVQTIFNLSVRTKLNKADLVWTCVPGNVTYNIYRGTTSGGPYALVQSGYTSSYCTYADFNLTLGTKYFWRVTSVDQAGTESLYSNEVSATPLSR